MHTSHFNRRFSGKLRYASFLRPLAPKVNLSILEKLLSIEDRGQTDHFTTPTRAGLRRCRWFRPRHATGLAALACS